MSSAADKAIITHCLALITAFVGDLKPLVCPRIMDNTMQKQLMAGTVSLQDIIDRRLNEKLS